MERGKFREKLQLAIREVVMNPPGHRPPVGALGVTVRKPWDDHCGQSPYATPSNAPIPDVTSIVALVGRAAQAMRIAEGIDRRSTIGGADRYPTKGCL